MQLMRRYRRTRRFGTGMALATTAAVAAGAIVAVSGTAQAANEVVNPGFEQGLDGWTINSGAMLTSVRGRSGRAARMTHPGPSTRTIALNDAKNTVSSTRSGGTFTARAWARTTAPGQSVSLRIMEYKGTVRQGEDAESTTLTGNGWQELTLIYRARTPGSSLDLNVVANRLPARVGVDVDDISLSSRGTQASRPPTATRKTTSTKTSNPAGWRLVWNDEFSGATVDTGKWKVENKSTYGDGNGELACLLNRPENVAVSSGSLHLRATREKTPVICGSSDKRFPQGRTYTSAHLSTRGLANWTYGRFEMRAKLPTAPGTSKGLWPAFWLRPTSGGIGELDVMEAVGTSNRTDGEVGKVHQTIWYDYTGTHPKQVKTSGVSPDPSTGYHVYAAEWSPGKITWFVDGVATFTRTTSTTSWLDSAFSAKPFYLRLNLAVGGSWPGTPDSATDFTTNTYDVDYVRVYKH
jgi:beta-glucanase (GH16 family)